MGHWHASHGLIGIHLLAASIIGLMPAGVMAETVIPVPPFRSVTLRDGGQVILRHGPVPRVTLVEGSTRHTAVSVEDGDRLVIDRCRDNCPEGYKAIVEIVAPEFVDVVVMDGGTIQSRGGFPRQGRIGVTVANGGTIDLRSIAVDHVDAEVRQGGRIFAKPQQTLMAEIAQGGVITYWDQPRVRSSIEHGGVVTHGAAGDIDRPLEELGPGALAPLPPVPAIPPAPPSPSSRRHTV